MSVDRWVDPGDDVVGAVRGSLRPVVLAGPGVVDDGCIPGLHALAVALSAGVLNTWGAKGVFDWRSRHHLATAGLQRDDWMLGGLAEADLILATGIDPDEAAGEWRLAPVVDVAPGALDRLAEQVGRPPADIAMPPLRERLAAMTQAGWARDAAPLPPSRVTRSYSDILGAGGFVAAEPGVAGYWVARTFGTTEVGSVHVPARRRPGLAATAAVDVHRHEPDRPVLVVTDDPVAAEVLAAVDGAGVAVEVWSAEGDHLDAVAHADRLRRGWTGVRTLAVDGSQLEAAVEAAGPIIAWGGING